ncbi:MAG: flagellar hook-associated protein FlgL [Eubacteriales bacterium]|nr:flagellar hook-associated protein FlgL [Eubacteriales bacterium]
MRVTNHMVTSSSLRNMQKSMQKVSSLNEQVTTGKKISAPSQDPVVAIRALKLRTTCDQLDQYKNKNIKDAMSWLDTTQTSIQNIEDRLQDVYYYCEQGAHDTFSTSDRSKIINELKALKESIYREGGTTYAGRYLFSGYKTETNLVFQDAAAKEGLAYSIEEPLDVSKAKAKNAVVDSVDTSRLDAILNGTDTYQSPSQEAVHILQLAYDRLDDSNFGMSFEVENMKYEMEPGTNNIKAYVKNADGSYTSVVGQSLQFTIKDATKPKEYYDVDDNEIALIPETGELVMGKDAYSLIKGASSFTANYDKSHFEVGDLRPEMYFNCTQTKTLSDGTTQTTDFTVDEEGQEIRYEVNFNQYLTVNAQGKDIIKHSMGNDIEDMRIAVQDMLDVEQTIATLKGYLNDPKYKDTPDAVKQINKMLEDADVELAMKRENMQTLFANNMTNFQNYMNDVGAEQAKVGTNYSKLELIATRVTEQLENFEELKSTNEDIETEEVALDMYQAELVYESALATTSNVIKKTLLDYI